MMLPPSATLPVAVSDTVVVSTVSVIAVFLPLAFLTTSTGKLFREFGVTVAVSVAISGFVALTLSPMLCGRVLRRHPAEHGIKAVLARGFERLADGYAATLRPTLRFGAIFDYANGLLLLQQGSQRQDLLAGRAR